MLDANLFLSQFDEVARGRGHLYTRPDGEFFVQAKEPVHGRKLSIGEISTFCLKYLDALSSEGDLKTLDAALLLFRDRVQNVRCCYPLSLLSSLLSSLYNLHRGYGMVDSLTLIENALEKVHAAKPKKSDKIDEVPEKLPFAFIGEGNWGEQDAKIFQAIAQDPLRNGLKKTIKIGDQEVELCASISRESVQFFSISSYPNHLFAWTEQPPHYDSEELRSYCERTGLDQLVVLKTSLITLTHAGTTKYLIAEKRADKSPFRFLIEFPIETLKKGIEQLITLILAGKIFFIENTYSLHTDARGNSQFHLKAQLKEKTKNESLLALTSHVMKEHRTDGLCTITAFLYRQYPSYFKELMSFSKFHEIAKDFDLSFSFRELKVAEPLIFIYQNYRRYAVKNIEVTSMAIDNFDPTQFRQELRSGVKKIISYLNEKVGEQVKQPNRDVLKTRRILWTTALRSKILLEESSNIALNTPILHSIREATTQFFVLNQEEALKFGITEVDGQPVTKNDYVLQF